MEFLLINQMNLKIKDIQPDFFALSKHIPSERLKKRIIDVCEEELQFVADELLLLSEEILSQVSAFGICLYLQKGAQKQNDRSNDYILHDLFLNREHQNAGPIFFNVCDIVQSIQSEISPRELELFVYDSDIHDELKGLATFRNALMHGFFILPSTKNEEQLIKFKDILEKLKLYGLFEYTADFHFWNDSGFTGNWLIQEVEQEWKKLSTLSSSSFGRLATIATKELMSDDFVNALRVKEGGSFNGVYKQELENFILGKTKGDFKESLFVIFHPSDQKQQQHFFEGAHSLLIEPIDAQVAVKLLSFSVNENGIAYSSYLLFNRLFELLSRVKSDLIEKYLDKKELEKIRLSKNSSLNKTKDSVQSLIKDIQKLDKENTVKIVVLVNDIHLVPFAHDHITLMMKFFKESGIFLIGIGHEYEHLSTSFSKKLDIRNAKNTIPNDIEIDLLIKNHTRHRGPFEHEPEQIELRSLIKHICKLLKSNKKVVARQLSDNLMVNTELVNEALYILYPFIKYTQHSDNNSYERDKPHERYNFSVNQSESSSIFLTLGRTDISLEYKHKILLL